MLKFVTAMPLTLLLASCSLVPHEGRKVSTFSELPATDRLEVHFRSTGCWHDYAYEFTFVRADGCRVSAPGLGSLSLSDSDLNDLDAMLRLYRSKHKGSGTTQERVTLVQMSAGKTVAKEKLVRRCPLWVGDNAPMTFDNLVKKMGGRT